MKDYLLLFLAIVLMLGGAMVAVSVPVLLAAYVSAWYGLLAILTVPAYLAGVVIAMEEL